MKKTNDDIHKILPDKDGMTVPQGYFEDFASRMTAMLPDRPELDELVSPTATVHQTLWHRVRPYVYMAAMFAGVWCMLKLFTMLTSDSPVPFESNPIVAEAFNNDCFVNDYVISDLNQWDIYDDLMNEGISPESFADSLFFTQYDSSTDFIN